MPAERSRGTKRNGADGMCFSIVLAADKKMPIRFPIDKKIGAQLTWTAPVEPSSHQSIAFAPNVTPVTFNDPPPTVDTAFEPILFPSPTAECSTRRPAHSKKRPDDHIPRPPNAFILFRSSFIKSQHVSTEVETNHSTLSKIIGLTWQNMPHDERQIWHAKAKKALEEHKRKFPQYAFRPSHTKAKGGTEKRKVREVEPKDMKRCAKIAELLVEGKKGQELDAAIQEFDRTHVPEVVTRFEAPITARTYRRSSSAPIDDPNAKKPFLTTLPAPRRIRSTSSQPSLLQQPTSAKVEEIPQHAPIALPETFFDFAESPSFVPSQGYAFPQKSQPSFELDPFLFDVTFSDSISPVTSQFASYPCSPNDTRVPSPALSVDTSYTSDWTAASSPFTSLPATPQSHSLPSPAFEQTCLPSDDPFTMSSYSMNGYVPNGQHYELQCVPDYSSTMHVYGHTHTMDGPIYTQPDYSSFSKEQYTSFEPAKTELAGVDMDFSAFMSSLPAY
ncbi:hypothetical protein BJ138DRAFT_1156566 [Hygrophoropsis aurantiaca]|uniref:Uncharacterized protein n=1 Tax=Hygrophoropsis aurantiaca TaxID=72124 RepID=A0ACB8A5Z8_9AGAM|nr:hypothetical protein BJ138DRAFT_1156566 [Hygrophoropsis aurantiaca]